MNQYISCTHLKLKEDMSINPSAVKHLPHLLKQHALCRVGLWIFVSIVAIEAMLLGPSLKLLQDSTMSQIRGIVLTQSVVIAIFAALATMFALSSAQMWGEMGCDRRPSEQVLRDKPAQMQPYLTIEIDPFKQAEEVAKIVEAESFQRVKHKLQQMRQAS